MKERNCGDVFSIDWRTSVKEARSILGNQTAIQGNLEPAILLASDRGFIAKRTQLVIDDNEGVCGHIFNLGHGILRDTPVENAKFVVDYVHSNTAS
jgi:uroporphyrinogen decarboxylase